MILLYPEAGLNDAAVKLLTIDYHEAFVDEKVSTGEFHHALKQVKKKCGFLPKIKDFLENVEEYRALPAWRKNPKQKAIADTESGREFLPEEIAINEKKMAVLVKQALREITEEEALEAINNLDERLKVFKGQLEV